MSSAVQVNSLAESTLASSCASARGTPQTFLEIARELRRHCPDLFTVDAQAESFRSQVEAARQHQINYGVDALTFNRAFFFRNLYKALLAAEWFGRQTYSHSGPIYDVGAGAGVFAIAWRCVFSIQRSPMVLLDPSSSQLGLARAYAQALGLTGFEFRRGRYPLDAPLGYGTRLFSYVFCEQDVGDDLTIADWVASLEGSQSLIIDYPSVIARLASALPRSARVERRSTEMTLPDEIATLVGQHSLTLHCLSVDWRAQERRLIDDYFWSWVKHDTRRLAHLFTPTALYEIFPRHRVLRGLRAIQDYWRRNRQRQQDLRLSWSVNPATHGMTCATFQADFSDSEEAQRQSIVGDLSVKSIDSRITLFSEHYEKHVLGPVR